ncbi:hypothetical protein PMIN04_009996 [Paraphaeosphaeria minitans]|uniref:Uncharacterized protein n=1 Tax=Paraphaeosphaeria minitans TaxID=565426 RepID=A0A9P6GE78_9PLEO|nr:hypothetical protein PMIN01_08389 [Paraphaeosphaeria minitans]
MRFLLPLFAIVSVAYAAVVGRDVGNPSAAVPAVALQEAASDLSNVEESLISARDDSNVVKLFVQKGTKGKYYRYTKDDTNVYTCMNYQRLVGEQILSVRQEVPTSKKGHVRCEYYTDTDCGSAYGKMTHEDEWVQGDLSKEPRKAPGENLLLGDWADRIGSVQCFWIRGAARRAEETGTSLVSKSFSGTPATGVVSTVKRSFSGPDPVELHVELDNKGRYYYYEKKDVFNYECKNIGRKDNQRILSVRQKRLPYLSNTRCHYYAEADCGSAQGTLTRTGHWEQPDLGSEFRKSGPIVLGSWEDQIRSVQCFWVRSEARNTEDTGSLLESTNANDDVHNASNGPALTDETLVGKDLELSDRSNDGNVLTRLYDAENFIGNQIAHATQKDTEREYCIKTNLKKGVFIRSIRQNKDSEDTWFVCRYHDDDHCNSDWNSNGVFKPFYLERDAYIKFNFAYKILSFRCRYADPGKRAAVSG